jgi:hypothetical protein
VEKLMEYIKEKREVKYVPDIKRTYNQWTYNQWAYNNNQWTYNQWVYNIYIYNN